MEENKLIPANMVHGTAGVQVQVYTTMKVQHGGQPAAWEKVTSNPPNDVSVDKSLPFNNKLKITVNKKASEQAKQQ